LGEQPSHDDLPPILGWEQPLWDLAQRFKRQWRTSFAGVVGLDMSVFLPVIQAKGWRLDFCLEIIELIEDSEINNVQQQQ